MNESVEEFVLSLKYNKEGLIPGIAQQYDTGEVLMMAWLNTESILATIKTGRVTYWSRSRSELWAKGETSDNYQFLKQIFYDCDSDTLLLKVDQHGPACHTGSLSCFTGREYKFNKNISEEK